MSEVSILSLGLRLDEKNGAIWKEVGKKALANRFCHVPAIFPDDWRHRRGREKEFFILYRGDEPIGRAAITLDRRFTKTMTQWDRLGLETKSLGAGKLGSIDDFAITPGYQEMADRLIGHCLSALKQKGVKVVMVRGHNTAILQASEGAPPPLIPYTPSWYIGIFQRIGFEISKEWLSFELKPLPSPQELPPPPDIKVRPLGLRDRRKMKDFIQKRAGFSPELIPGAQKPYSILRFYPAFLIQKLIRFKTYVAELEPGKIGGYCRFMAVPEPTEQEAEGGLGDIFGQFKAKRKSKSCMVLGVRFGSSYMRKVKGPFSTLVVPNVPLLRKEGFEGLFLVEPKENPVVGPILTRFLEKFGDLVSKYLTQLRYYTLTYSFDKD